ncbi:MAG: NUDIX hydrolase [Oscillospiraceae bacterium]|nr:NUDIX hydrolase [Oscillospiraceae bacterium]
MHEPLNIELQDTEWEYTYTDHDRMIARAIVFDDDGKFYFVKTSRDDNFGRCSYIGTSGGGVEPGEKPEEAIKRELNEELGVTVDVICKLGVVSDYYNLIHRHNINNFYLCKITAFGEKHLNPDEINDFHLSTVKLTYEEALQEYENAKESKLGRLVAQCELPILRHAKEIMDELT